jgi:hypothetical protein
LSDTPTYRIEYPTLVYDDRTPSQSFSAREVVGVRGEWNGVPRRNGTVVVQRQEKLLYQA